jgi:AraC-like DNA-binding protein
MSWHVTRALRVSIHPEDKLGSMNMDGTSETDGLLSTCAILARPVTDFQRARQPDQKAKRRAHVLATAREILADGAVDLGQLTLNELARRVGMAKSNLYRYFETRSHMATSYRRPARGRPALDALVRHLARTLAHVVFCVR